MQSPRYTELDQFTLLGLEVLAAQTTTLSPQAIHVAQRDTLIHAIMRAEVKA